MFDISVFSLNLLFSFNFENLSSSLTIFKKRDGIYFFFDDMIAFTQVKEKNNYR